MDSSFILDKYLVSQSSLDNIISFDQFKKECPTGVSDHLLRQIYEELMKQRNNEIVNKVKARIIKEFDVPLQINDQAAFAVELMPTNKQSVTKLVNDLSQLEQKIGMSQSTIDKEINHELKSVKLIIDELNDLRYGKAWTRGGNSSEVGDIVKEAMKSISRCENFLE